MSDVVIKETKVIKFLLRALNEIGPSGTVRVDILRYFYAHVRILARSFIFEWRRNPLTVKGKGSLSAMLKIS